MLCANDFKRLQFVKIDKDTGDITYEAQAEAAGEGAPHAAFQDGKEVAWWKDEDAALVQGCARDAVRDGEREWGEDVRAHAARPHCIAKVWRFCSRYQGAMRHG